MGAQLAYSKWHVIALTQDVQFNFDSHKYRVMVNPMQFPKSSNHNSRQVNFVLGHNQSLDSVRK
jgi:hypothetical protein